MDEEPNFKGFYPKIHDFLLKRRKTKDTVIR